MSKLKMVVIGKDVSKSLSPKMHTFIMTKLGVDMEYTTLSILEENFDQEINEVLNNYDTINVTIPYKINVIPYLNMIKSDAKTFGAVNTITTKDKIGYNTDGIGFMLLLQNEGIEIKDKSVLVLGSGGVGRSVIIKLVEAGAKVSSFDLNQKGLMSVYDEFPHFTPLSKIVNVPYDIIINCTGVGMHKTEGKSPVGTELLSLCSSAVDLIYEPKKSEFLRLAELCDKKIVNGESMLFYQAYYADCIFIGKEPDANEAKALFEEYKN